MRSSVHGAARAPRTKEKRHEQWDAICTSAEHVVARLHYASCTDATIWPRAARGGQTNFARGAQKAAMFVQRQPCSHRLKISMETSGSSHHLRVQTNNQQTDLRRRTPVYGYPSGAYALVNRYEWLYRLPPRRPPTPRPLSLPPPRPHHPTAASTNCQAIDHCQALLGSTR